MSRRMLMRIKNQIGQKYGFSAYPNGDFDHNSLKKKEKKISSGFGLKRFDALFRYRKMLMVPLFFLFFNDADGYFENNYDIKQLNNQLGLDFTPSFCCQRHASASASSRLSSVFQPSTFSAFSVDA